jgi:hypothetical protein
VAEASNELGLATDAIKRDIGQALLALEGAQEEMLAATMAKPTDPTISASDEVAATAWLKGPRPDGPSMTTSAECSMPIRRRSLRSARIGLASKPRQG